MTRFSITPLALLIAGTLAACGGAKFTAGGRDLPVPDDPGLYALTRSGELRRLDGSPSWERETWARRSDLSPDVEFIVHEPGIGGAAGNGAAPAGLWRVAWVRSDILPTGAAAPAQGSEWVQAGLDTQSQPVAATWHPEIRGLFHLAPTSPLAPGLYELRLEGGSGERARIGVAWSSVDRREYAAANCVDRIVGEPVRFQPCGAASGAGVVQAARAMAPQPISAPPSPQPVAAAPPLRITLADPVREDDGLRIRGTVVNTSAQARRVPMLQGTILDASGTPADRWFFSALEPSVGPGQEVSFTSWRRAPPGAARLDVDFVAR